MSKKIRAAVLASGLWEFEDAVRFRDAMAKTLNGAYTFVDLMCFMCLQNRDCFDHKTPEVALLFGSEPLRARVALSGSLVIPSISDNTKRQ